MCCKNDAGIDEKNDAVPFTAKLTAYHRAAETKRKESLFEDPYAELLVGDISDYAKEHRYSMARDGYTIARTYYIDEYLLRPWLSTHKESQIILLGAGLDTRAYRFAPLKNTKHTIFELDLPVTIKYKTRILEDQTPLCRLVRIPTDMSKPDWIHQLLDAGFSEDIPSLWILEGLLYYIPKTASILLLRTMSEISSPNSELFTDTCVPPIAELKFGPFTRHFEWGIEIMDIPAFFAKTGWDVSCVYADEYDQGRDVGQKGMIFVRGENIVET
ncbi:MAG: hypothetical protein BAJATHORv1_10577 [Candidatus Thorarchaeota archaeon]|nr:MAG: hypothetical protein BAJATHORv1_10577 [Candidatus Thorarchaeota archaeon]